MATITVVTVYDGLTELEVRQWANKAFKPSMMGGNLEFSIEQVSDIKSRFLKGEHVGAQADHPTKPGVKSKTRWKLDREIILVDET